MASELTKAQQAYLPMSEAAFYILLSLTEPRHGYGIMQHVEEITAGRLRLGPGTLYGSLTRMQDDELIEPTAEVERRKIYAITASGRLLLRCELARLHELYTNGKKHMGDVDHG
jgi:DNA-binding PadR family transcriptional regulator